MFKRGLTQHPRPIPSASNEEMVMMRASGSGEV